MQNQGRNRSPESVIWIVLTIEDKVLTQGAIAFRRSDKPKENPILANFGWFLSLVWLNNGQENQKRKQEELNAQFEVIFPQPSGRGSPQARADDGDIA